MALLFAACGHESTGPEVARGDVPCTGSAQRSGCVEVTGVVLDADGRPLPFPAVSVGLVADGAPLLPDSAAGGADGRYFLRLGYYSTADSLTAPAEARPIYLRASVQPQPSGGGAPAPRDSVRVLLSAMPVGALPLRYTFTLRTSIRPAR